MNDLAKFYWLCLKHAIRSTAEYFSFQKPGSYLNWGVPAVLTFGLMWWREGDDAFLTEVQNYLYFVAGALGWTILVFLGKCISAPYHVRMDELIVPEFQVLFGTGGSFVQEAGIGTLYRIGVKNTSRKTSIESVSVALTDISPGEHSFLPVQLHLMNDNSPRDQHTKQFRLDPDETVFVDLLEIYNKANEVQYMVKHIVLNLGEQFVKLGDTLTVSVQGKNCPSAESSFRVVDRNGRHVLEAAG